MEQIISRVCRRCGVDTPADLLVRHKQCKGGFDSLCVSCRRDERREDYIKNGQSYRERASRWFNENRDAAILYRRTHYRKTKALCMERAKKWKRENRAKVTKASREYRSRNKISAKIWARRKGDPIFRLKKNMRTRFAAALSNNAKKSSVWSLVGCSFDEFRAHIASQFERGMNWGNYGEWHVDHIIPCSAYDHSNEAELKRCWNYKNMRPLWSFHNESKGDLLSPMLALTVPVELWPQGTTDFRLPI